MKVATPQGEVDLIQPDGRRLRSLRAALPLGALAYSSEVNGARYGIVMKRGDTESWAIKQQPPEVPEESLQAACLGLDYRPRSALEQLGFQFLVRGSEVFCLKTKISEQDPIWTAIRSTGIDRMYHLPSVPAEIAQEQLSIAKPQDDKGEHGGAGNADKPGA
jgi:hypothetical protein